MLYTIGLWLCLLTGYPLIIEELKKRKMVRANYRGEQIPVGVGVTIPLIQILSLPWSVWESVERLYFVQTSMLILIAYAGWRDDRYGGMEAKGLKGHVSLWWKEGIWSTGMAKAATGAWVAIVLSTLYSQSVWEWVLHASLIVLLTNQINLLDLRPGRAMKGFGVYAILILSQTHTDMPLMLWLPIVLTVFYIFQGDIRGKVMLGDTGSNVLGFAIAFWVVVTASLMLKVTLVVVGLVIQLYAEKNSISALIQKTPVLYWLDRLGRRET